MTTTEALAELKNYLRETTYDAAWGDDLLTAYMSEGQDKFCEGTGYFFDFSTNTITLVADQDSYDVPSRTIEIQDIWNGTKRLQKFREEDRGLRELTWNPSNPINRTGTPYGWQTDRTTGKITLDATPTSVEAGTVLTVSVWRYSNNPLTTSDVIEIPLQFQRAIIEYAASKALMSHDMEQQDKVKAGDHAALFREYVRDGKRAMQRFHGQETRVGTDQSYVY